MRRFARPPSCESDFVALRKEQKELCSGLLVDRRGKEMGGFVAYRARVARAQYSTSRNFSDVGAVGPRATLSSRIQKAEPRRTILGFSSSVGTPRKPRSIVPFIISGCNPRTARGVSASFRDSAFVLIRHCSSNEGICLSAVAGPSPARSCRRGCRKGKGPIRCSASSVDNIARRRVFIVPRKPRGDHCGPYGSEHRQWRCARWGSTEGCAEPDAMARGVGQSPV
ncbi:hypothetical protein OF83DRAFT_605887 [Amylostereum chailletii]|nr:hypothetical protein OF83DRAFT_605887 [Amylostereum chailletii]